MPWRPCRAELPLGTPHRHRRSSVLLMSGSNSPLRTENTERAVTVVSSLLRVSQLLRSLTTAHYAEFGLNDVRHSVLHTIRSFEPDGCSQAELAAALRQSESNICTLVDRMRTDGLLYRQRSKEDRRKRILLISERGRNLLQKVEACHGLRMHKLMQPLSAGQLKALDDALKRLLQGLSPQSECDTAPDSTVREPHFSLKSTSSTECAPCGNSDAHMISPHRTLERSHE